VGRFLLFGLVVLLLLQAGFAVAGDSFGFAPEARSLSGRLHAPEPVPASVQVAAWLLEATALLALFLLIQGRSGAWWLDGLATGWIAWIFRGPLLVFAVVAYARLPREPWWGLAFHWLALYSLCGLAIALLARWFKVERA
jgi:hypothetical protein